MSVAAPLFDSDQHYYEPRDCFTRCMATKAPRRLTPST